MHAACANARAGGQRRRATQARSTIRGQTAALLTILAAMLSSAVSASATEAAPATCEAQPAALKVPGGQTYMSGGFSEVEHTYVCAYAGGQTVEIGEAGREDASSGGGEGPIVHRLVFAGETAAVIYTNENGSKALDVVDLDAGRVQFTCRLGGGGATVPGEYSNAGSHDVGAIVVKRDGSVAWTEQLHRGAYEVLAHDAKGTAVLDRSGTVSPHSLTLTGSTLRWRERDGKRRSATLH